MLDGSADQLAHVVPAGVVVVFDVLELVLSASDCQLPVPVVGPSAVEELNGADGVGSDLPDGDPDGVVPQGEAELVACFVVKLLGSVEDEIDHGLAEDGVLVELELEMEPGEIKDEVQVLLLDGLALEVEPLEVQEVVHVLEVGDRVEVLELGLDVLDDVFVEEVLVFEVEVELEEVLVVEMVLEVVLLELEVVELEEVLVEVELEEVLLEVLLEVVLLELEVVELEEEVVLLLDEVVG